MTIINCEQRSPVVRGIKTQRSIMQISSKTLGRNQSGYALAIVLCFLVVTLIVFASIMYWVTSSANLTQRNNLYNVSQAAAQGAIELTLAQMDRDFIYQNINSSDVYAPLAAGINQSSWPVQFTFSDTNGHANQIYVSIYPTDWTTNFKSDLGSQFAGLYGYAAECTLVAKATPNANSGYDMSAIVQETANLAAIPIFQFGVFYNLDLDFSPGQSLTMNGKVHVNGTMWMCPQSDAYFNDVVEATGVVTNADNPNDQQNLTYNSSYRHVVTLSGGNPRNGVDPLNIPIAGNSTNSSGTNAEAILNLPPTAIAAPNATAYYTSNQVYLYNKCDLIISNSAYGINGARGTNITIYYQDKDQSGGPLFQLTNKEVCTFSNVSTHSTVCWTTNSPNLTNINYICIASSFPFVTNVAFFDFREGKTVQAVQIDIGLLNTWLTNPLLEGSNWNYVCGGSYGMGGSASVTGNKGHPIDTIFVYNSVPLTATTLPAVRVVNGQQLPTHWGLSIATPMPIYVKGDYNIQTNAGGSKSQLMTNTAWTRPAALMGDAITVLSATWNDSATAYQSGGNLSSRTPTFTTINAACLEGIVPSTKVGSTKHYSGGLENFLRLLETGVVTLFVTMARSLSCFPASTRLIIGSAPALTMAFRRANGASTRISKPQMDRRLVCRQPKVSSVAIGILTDFCPTKDVASVYPFTRTTCARESCCPEAGENGIEDNRAEPAFASNAGCGIKTAGCG